MHKILLLLSLFYCTTSAVVGGWAVAADVTTLPVQDTHHPIEQKVRESLTLISFNIAHGRGLSLNQLLVSPEKTRSNLIDIANFLVKNKGDIVALQEADGPSFWSGNFHHLAFLADQGGYPQFIHASHANIMIGHYGTGVMSRLHIQAGYGLTFPPSPPTASKGLTLAEIEWQTKKGTIPIDVVSVHLDFSRKTVRKQQLDEIQTALAKRRNPLIIMGDFNSEWIAKQLTGNNSLSLHTYYDEADNLASYEDKRLDWILVSDDFIFESYEVSPLKYSDHLAVIATVRLASPNVGI